MYENVRNEFCYRVPIYDNFIKYDIFMNLLIFDDFNRCSEIYNLRFMFTVLGKILYIII